MKNFLNKIYYSLLFSFVFVFIFSFFVFGLIPNAPLKVNADSNLNSVGLEYSNDFNTDSMPSYNKVILDNEPFYQGNNLYEDFYNVTIPFYGRVDNNDKSYLVVNEIILTPASSGDITTLYNECVVYWHNQNYIFGNYRYKHKITQYFGYLSSNCSIDFLCDYVDISYNDRVYIKFCVSDTNIIPTKYVHNGEVLPTDLEVEIEGNNVNILNIPASSVYSVDFNFLMNLNLLSPITTPVSVNLYDSYVSRSFGDIVISFVHNVYNSYYFNYGAFKYFNNFSYALSEGFDGVNYSFNSVNLKDINISLNNVQSNSMYGWNSTTGIILNSIVYKFGSGHWINFNWFPNNDIAKIYFSYNYYAPHNLVNSFNFDNQNFDSNALYKQDVQWYDIFGHLYNFMIYLIFDMPLISNITKPIYFAIDSFITTLNWTNGIVLGLGIFGAFAMVCLIFAIIKRFL